MDFPYVCKFNFNHRFERLVSFEWSVITQAITAHIRLLGNLTSVNICQQLHMMCLLLFAGAVVGALAHRIVGVSRCVSEFDCSDLQVLQSSDLSLPAHE